MPLILTSFDVSEALFCLDAHQRVTLLLLVPASAYKAISSAGYSGEAGGVRGHVWAPNGGRLDAKWRALNRER